MDNNDQQALSNEENINKPIIGTESDPSLEKLDTEFPLSGGETNEDLEKVLESDSEEEEETIKDDSVEKLDEDFPLSGGETDEDLENALGLNNDK